MQDLEQEPVSATAAFEPPASPRRARGGVSWAGVAVVSAALLASGGARWWQERQVNAALESGRYASFQLETVPLVFGDWKGQVEPSLDPIIARATGCTDHV